VNLYQRYLLHDRIVKLLERSGGEVYSISDNIATFWKPATLEDFVEKYWGATITVMTTTQEPQRNEEIAEAVLATLPPESVTVRRQDGVLDLLAHLNGESVRIYLGGGGTCERVVVGHEWVEAVPEQIVPAKEGYAKEIVEWRCPDPIVEAGLV
jgi:hypothetical protein